MDYPSNIKRLRAFLEQNKLFTLVALASTLACSLAFEVASKELMNIKCLILNYGNGKNVGRNKLKFELSDKIEGSSPPSIFVSSQSYPSISVAPMVPPIYGDTSILDEPEKWLGKPLEEIIKLRQLLIRGTVRFKQTKGLLSDKMILKFQELFLSSRPVESYMTLSKLPSGKILLDRYCAPFGPVAPLLKFEASVSSSDRSMEYVFYDTDMNAEDAVFYLYIKGINVSKIEKAFSTGMLGERRKRRLVPTKWSITAVDDIISRKLKKEIEQYDTIDEYRVYHFSIYQNSYSAILLPTSWRFEWIEAWFPGTQWNKDSSFPLILGDHEEYKGRKDYAKVGGCYYSTRLGILEALSKEKRKAGAIVLREVYPGSFLNIGVWNIRESVRAMMKQRYSTYSSFRDALKDAIYTLRLSEKDWLNSSYMIKRELMQTTLRW